MAALVAAAAVAVVAIVVAVVVVVVVVVAAAAAAVVAVEVAVAGSSSGSCSGRGGGGGGGGGDGVSCSRRRHLRRRNGEVQEHLYICNQSPEQQRPPDTPRPSSSHNTNKRTLLTFWSQLRATTRGEGSLAPAPKSLGIREWLCQVTSCSSIGHQDGSMQKPFSEHFPSTSKNRFGKGAILGHLIHELESMSPEMPLGRKP